MADQDNPQPPAGWYPDPTQPGQQRYWDGTQWTEHTAPGGGDSGTAAASQAASIPSGTGAYGTGTYGSQTYGAGAGGGEKPDPWLWQSIVATILCCNVLGVVGVVHAARAQQAIDFGDLTTARDRAQKAKTWTLVAAGLGVLAVLAWFSLVLAGVSMGGFESGQF